MLVLIAVFAIFLGLNVSAVEPAYTSSYVQEISSLPKTDNEQPPEASEYILDPNFSDTWIVSSNSIRMSRQKINGTAILQLNFRDSFSDKEMQLTYHEPCSLKDYTTLSLPLNIETADNSSVGNCRVTVELIRSENDSDTNNQTQNTPNKVLTQAMVPVNTWHEIVIDITEAEALESITVTFTFDTIDVPERIRISPLQLNDSIQNNYVSRYSTSHFKISGGRLNNANGVVSLHPFGTLTEIDGNFALNELPTEGTQAFMLVTLSGNITGGTVTMGCRSAKSEIMTYADCGALQLQNGRYIYSFPFLASDAMISYRLSFRNCTYTGNGIRIESISIVFTEDSPPRATGNGFVSGIALNRENGRLTIQGSVSQTITNTYKKDSLVVYAVPYTAECRIEEQHTVWEGTEIHRSKLFMNFELILDAELTARYVGTHMFYVTVEGEEHAPILLSMPMGADYGVDAETEHSIVGIEGGSAVGTFESNASHVIVDIPFDRLVVKTVTPAQQDKTDPTAFLTANTLKTHTPDGTAIYLDTNLLKELLTEIGFYHSANLDVYLRISDASTVFINNISRLNAWDMEVYSAILTAILTYDSSLMQNAISGVILGEAVCYSEEAFAGEKQQAKNLYTYTAKLSALINVTYSTVNSCLRTSQASVVVPYAANGSYNPLVNQMLAWHNKRTGSPIWYVMYCFSTADKAETNTFDSLIYDAERLLDTSSHFGPDGESAGCLYFYVPNADYSAESITMEYNAFCEDVLPKNPKAVFLSVRGVLDERKEQLYRSLKTLRNGEKNSTIVTIEANTIPTTPEPDEKNTFEYTVWDFSNLYHNNGWVSGGAVAGCGTERSEIFSQDMGKSCRALRTKVYSNFENSMASAIVLRNFNQSIDFSGVDQLVFRFSIAETQDTSTLIFVMGNERIRAEYPLTDVTPSTVHAIRCPLSEFSGKNDVDYIGVMVYSGESAVLEIQSVTLQSQAMSPDSMAALFTLSEEELPDKGLEAYFTIGIILVITVFASVMLIHRDKEESDRKSPPPHSGNQNSTHSNNRTIYYTRK